MKTSARNQFHGKVTQVKAGAVHDEIELEVAGGHQIVAVITRDSSENLGLKAGAQAIALIKSSSIILLTDGEGVRFSARNQLSGTVTSVKTGAVNTEVTLALPGGAQVAAIITNDSAAALELAPGKAATALFKASSVILGVPA